VHDHSGSAHGHIQPGAAGQVPDDAADPTGRLRFRLPVQHRHLVALTLQQRHKRAAWTLRPPVTVTFAIAAPPFSLAAVTPAAGLRVMRPSQ